MTKSTLAKCKQSLENWAELHCSVANSPKIEETDDGWKLHINFLIIWNSAFIRIHYSSQGAPDVKLDLSEVLDSLVLHFQRWYIHCNIEGVMTGRNTPSCLDSLSWTQHLLKFVQSKPISFEVPVDNKFIKLIIINALAT